MRNALARRARAPLADLRDAQRVEEAVERRGAWPPRGGRAGSARSSRPGARARRAAAFESDQRSAASRIEAGLEELLRLLRAEPLDVEARRARRSGRGCARPAPGRRRSCSAGPPCRPSRTSAGAARGAGRGGHAGAPRRPCGPRAPPRRPAGSRRPPARGGPCRPRARRAARARPRCAASRSTRVTPADGDGLELGDRAHDARAAHAPRDAAQARRRAAALELPRDGPARATGSASRAAPGAPRRPPSPPSPSISNGSVVARGLERAEARDHLVGAGRPSRSGRSSGSPSDASAPSTSAWERIAAAGAPRPSRPRRRGSGSGASPGSTGRAAAASPRRSCAGSRTAPRPRRPGGGCRPRSRPCGRRPRRAPRRRRAASSRLRRARAGCSGSSRAFDGDVLARRCRRRASRPRRAARARRRARGTRRRSWARRSSGSASSAGRLRNARSGRLPVAQLLLRRHVVDATPSGTGCGNGREALRDRARHAPRRAAPGRRASGWAASSATSSR